MTEDEAESLARRYLDLTRQRRRMDPDFASKKVALDQAKEGVARAEQQIADALALNGGVHANEALEAARALAKARVALERATGPAEEIAVSHKAACDQERQALNDLTHAYYMMERDGAKS